MFLFISLSNKTSIHAPKRESQESVKQRLYQLLYELTKNAHLYVQKYQVSFNINLCSNELQEYSIIKKSTIEVSKSIPKEYEFTKNTK